MGRIRVDKPLQLTCHSGCVIDPWYHSAPTSGAQQALATLCHAAEHPAVGPLGETLCRPSKAHVTAAASPSRSTRLPPSSPTAIARFVIEKARFTSRLLRWTRFEFSPGNRRSPSTSSIRTQRSITFAGSAVFIPFIALALPLSSGASTRGASTTLIYQPTRGRHSTVRIGSARLAHVHAPSEALSGARR